MFRLLGQPMRIYHIQGENGAPDQWCIQAHGRNFFRDELKIETVCFMVQKPERQQFPRAWVETRGFLEGDRVVSYPSFGLSAFSRLQAVIGKLFN